MEQANYSDLLDTLKELHDVDTFKVRLVSSNTDIELRKLKLNQQRDIIKSITDSRLSEILFNIAMSKIIRDNYTGDRDINIVDIPVLALAMRSESVNDKLTISSSDGETEHVISLREHIDSVSNDMIDDNLHRAVFHANIPAANRKISVRCKIPSIDNDIATNYESLLVIKNNIESGSDDVSDVVGKIVVYEISKYIESVSITDSNVNDDDESFYRDIKFKDLNIQQKVDIMESLPATINNKISEYIDNITEFRDNQMVTADGLMDIEITPNIFISDK